MTLRKKADITQYSLFYYFIIIPFLQPADYILPAAIRSLLDLWKLSSMLLILLVYLSKRKISSFMIVFALFQLTTVAATVFNPLSHTAELKNSLIISCTNIAILMAAEIGLNAQPHKFIKAAAYYGGVMCLITAATMFYYHSRGGMDQKEYMDALGDVNFYFLGHDNRSYFIFLSVQTAVIILSMMRCGKLSVPAVLFTAVVTAAFFYVRSAASMICAAFICIYLLLFRKGNPLFMNFKNYVIAFLTFDVLIVFLNIQNLFTSFLTNVLHKSTTISGRTIIWAKAMSYIKKSFFIGYGRESLAVLLVKFGINHVHNIILDIMYSQGLIGFILYAVMIFMCGKSLMKYRSNRISATVSFIFFAFFICSIFDYYNTMAYPMLLYSFAVNIGRITAAAQKNTEETAQKAIGENYVTNKKLT